MLACLRGLRGAARDEPLPGLGPPALGEPDLVAFCLEHPAGLFHQCNALRLHALVRPVEAESAEPHRGAGSRDRGLCRACVRDELESASICHLVVRVRKLQRERKPPLVARREAGDGPLEERGGRAGVATIEGGPARRREVLRCALGQTRQLRCFGIELPPVAVGLLQVVAEDLLALDELLPLEPVREVLMEICPRCLRQRLVRGIADQDVTKAEGLVPGVDGAVRTDELLPDECRKMRLDTWADRRRKRGNRAAVEHLPLDGAAVDHDALVPRERIEARLEERVDRRRNDELVVFAPLARHREHLVEKERVTLRGDDDAPARLVVDCTVRKRVDQPVAIVGGKRLEQERRRVELPTAPPGLRVEQLGTSDTEEENRCTAREVGDVLDELEERSLGPVDVVEHNDLPTRDGPLFEETTECELRLGGRAAEDGLRLDTDREQQFDERPVRDPVAVVETATPEDVRLLAGVLEEVGDEP